MAKKIKFLGKAWTVESSSGVGYATDAVSATTYKTIDGKIFRKDHGSSIQYVTRAIVPEYVRKAVRSLMGARSNPRHKRRYARKTKRNYGRARRSVIRSLKRYSKRRKNPGMTLKQWAKKYGEVVHKKNGKTWVIPSTEAAKKDLFSVKGYFVDGHSAGVYWLTSARVLGF